MRDPNPQSVIVSQLETVRGPTEVEAPAGVLTPAQKKALQGLEHTLPAQSGAQLLEKRPGVPLRPIVIALAALCAALGVALFLALQRATPVSVAPTGKVSAALPPPSAEARPKAEPLPCKPGVAARRLDRKVNLKVGINVEADAKGKLLVGYAESRTMAIGLALSLKDLTTRRLFEKESGPALVGVVPIQAGGSTQFATDRVNHPLRSMHTLTGEPRISIGAVDAGFAQWTRGKKPRLIWPGDGREPITVPRSARVEDGRQLVVFRRGGRTGSILAGWLTAAGEAESELSEIAVAEEGLGTPSVAVGPSSLLVTFAVKQATNSAWRIALAGATLGKVPRQAEFFEPTGIEDEKARIAPVAVAVGDDRWLLMWTEGSTGNYQVKAQTLNLDLEHIGNPLLLSPPELNAGQGTLGAVRNRAAALFIATGESGPELWAGGLQCD